MPETLNAQFPTLSYLKSLSSAKRRGFFSQLCCSRLQPSTEDVCSAAVPETFCCARERQLRQYFRVLILRTSLIS